MNTQSSKEIASCTAVKKAATATKDHCRNGIIRLNVGGKLFVTSAQTLTNTSTDSFLSRIVSESGLPSTLDDTGAYFVDRCPLLFEKILTFLRTKRIRLGDVDIDDMLFEADYYGVQPLIDRLKVCKQLYEPSCGNLSFCGFVPTIPVTQPADVVSTSQATPVSQHVQGQKEPIVAVSATDKWLAVACNSGVSCYSTRQFSGETNCINPFAPWFQSTNGSKPLLLALKSLKHSSRDERSEQLIVACVTHCWHLFIWKQSIESESGGGGNHLHPNPPVKFVGKFPLFENVNALVFAGRRQIVALNYEGSFAVWHYSRDFQQQKLEEAICSFDECGSMVFFGHNNGIIRYFNAETLPVRLEDNKIILRDLYHDSESDAITALNVRLASNNGVMAEIGSMENQFYFEIAYGTASGKVNLISEHAETIGQGPQLLFSFSVHRSPIVQVMISENHLISNCSNFNHVRCWQISRFRGILSRNPLPMPLSSFKMLHLEPKSSSHEYTTTNPIGPHLLSESQVWYLQKITPAATEIFVISALTGSCLHRIVSVDASPINCFSITEEWRRVGNPTQYLFTGHENGSIQVWNLSINSTNQNAFSNNTSSSSCNFDQSQHVTVSHLCSRDPSPLLYMSNEMSPLSHSLYHNHRVGVSKSKIPFSPAIPNELHPDPNKTNHPSIDEILKMLDQYDISQSNS